MLVRGYKDWGWFWGCGMVLEEVGGVRERIGIEIEMINVIRWNVEN